MTFQTIIASGNSDDDTDASVVVETRPKTRKPPLYKVLLLNDDYTPMEFVVLILERFFGLTHAQSFEIMLTVHKKGGASDGFRAPSPTPFAMHHGKRISTP